MTDQQFQLHEGDEVFAADGDKIGKLAGITDNDLIIEKGFLFPTDYFIPFGAVSSYDQDKGEVYLSVSKDDALNGRWGEAKVADAGPYTPPAASRDVKDDMTIDVHEEELVATKTMREAGDVKINKRVVSEEQTMDVPVTEERLHVTRRTVDRDTTTGADTFREETIDVPLRTEEVNLEKRARVVEEIDLDKEAVQRTEKVGGTVRKEVVDVDESMANNTAQRKKP